MKTSLTSFDLRALVAEWQGLVGGHVDKIYQREDEVILRINLAGGGKVELYSKAGRWLCLHELETKPISPPPFAQTLRRLLDNARIVGIEQRGFDRIAVFAVERGPDALRVIFEIFGNGNLIVTKGDTTVAVQAPQAFKDRKVQVGEPYAFPAAGVDPLELDRGEFAETLRGAKGQVVRVLASILNLGGTYAEELCLRAAVPKETRVRELTDSQIDGLYTALNNLAVAVEQERRPAVVFQAGRAVEATPIELIQHRGLERREFPTFNEALSHYLTVAEPEAEGAKAESAAAKYLRRIAQQEESLAALREEATLLEAQAVFLYGHYSVFDELLKAVRGSTTVDARRSSRRNGSRKRSRRLAQRWKPRPRRRSRPQDVLA